MSDRTVVISGASGTIGSALAPLLEARGFAVRRLVRRPPRTAAEAQWDPARGTLAPGAIDGAVAVVNLAGENVGHRWTGERKRRILESRLTSTATLAKAVAAMPTPPVLVNGSAVGYYGDRGDELLAEGASAGRGFLASVCEQWEGATSPARLAGARVVCVRTGVVLDPASGALGKMLTPFRAGVGGPLGDGRQWMSWITLTDVARAFAHAVADERVTGAVNAVSPAPVTNAEFTKALASALHRPALLAVPGVALRLAFGQMAEETLLASQRAVPAALTATGFAFEHPALGPALATLLS